MTEEKVKSRGWVKNAAIIFLSVMLVLTFFSNTIMNRSLPEVAMQSAQSGTITTRIRGSGNITATETFEVKSSDARKVKSVAVKVGDKVEVGDLLVTLAEGDSSELDSARQALESAQYSYQSALLDVSSTDENGETTAIARAKQKLADAMEIRTYSDKVTVAQVYAAKETWEKAQAVADAKEELYNEAEAKLAAAGGYKEGSDSTGDYSAVSSASAALQSARNDLAAVEIQHLDAYKALTILAQYEFETSKKWSAAAYMKSLAEEYSPVVTAATAPVGVGEGAVVEEGLTVVELMDAVAAVKKIDPADVRKLHDAATPAINVDITEPFDINNTNYKPFTKVAMATAYAKITAAGEAVASAQSAYDSAYNSYYASASASAAQNVELKKASDKAKAVWDTEKAKADKLKDKYDDLSARKTEYDTASQSVLDAQDALEAAVNAQQKDNLNLQQLRSAIGRAQQQVAAASGGGSGGEIRSDVAGVVAVINTTAGNMTDPGTPVLTVEVPDRGYSVSFAVTAEQAKKVTIGDSADITTSYWGGPDLTGRLTSIRPDPQNPQTSKLLVFEITGEDIQSGTQVSVSIGQKSQSYDVIVPNSAVREDANGSFVLLIVAKSSPLGNRYTATRADVNVLAKDDTNSAVAGGIAAWDYVLTSSTKPIESGMQVRIAENG